MSLLRSPGDSFMSVCDCISDATIFTVFLSVSAFRLYTGSKRASMLSRACWALIESRVMGMSKGAVSSE